MSASSKDEKVVVDGSEKRSDGKSGLRRRRLWLVPVVIVVILAAGASGLAYRAKKLSERVTIVDASTIQTQADEIEQTEGPTAALKVYQNAISNAADQQTLALLEELAAGKALDARMDVAALNYALKADTILHSADSSELVGYVYQQKGDKAAAITYYKLAAKEVPPNRITGNSSQYYLNEAQALSGAQP